MTRRPDQRKDTSKYFLKFTLTAIILGGMTLFLVLVVLPGRYLLSAGLQESGVNFPSETAPFNPPAGQHIEAPPPPPPFPPSQGPIRGAAEVLWEQVGPLLEAGRYAQALSLFEAYLLSYPGDRGVHREYAITLSRAGRAAEAIQAYQRLLAQKDDPGIRLLLARSLRDRGRVAEASTHYSILAAGDPSDAALSLEWGRALSWNKRFYEATEVLAAAFSRNPGSTQLAIELAQVYYWSGRLGDADRVLAELDAATLDSAGAAQLRNDVSAALARPEPEEDPGEEEPLEEDLPEETPDATPPSFLDLAATALSNEDFEGAAELFKAALKEAPEDSATWRRYADLLQYQLEDLEGAREALRRMEELGAESMAVRFRLAQLSLWTGRNEEAKLRLQRLADAIESDPVPIQTDGFTGLGTREAAEVQALLGDLHRWEGDRVRSGRNYQRALDVDPLNPRAAAGLRELEAEAASDIEAIESPGLGANAFSLSDSDDFSRMDLGIEGAEIRGNWVWDVRTGSRWLQGMGLDGAIGSEQGLFLELESARWWGWGAVRSGLHMGLDEFGPDQKALMYGASLLFQDLAGFKTDLRYDHGLAYPLTTTLQSLLAEASRDRLTATFARQVNERWSLSLAGDGAWISTPRVGASGGDGSLRVEGGASLGRSFTEALMLGLNARGLTYTAAAPVLNGSRLFWDPRGVAAGGIFAQWAGDLRDQWQLTTRLNPTMAFIDERVGSGYELVPHLTAETGLTHTGRRFLTRVEAFYYQGRFDGYRAYGLRASISARSWFGRQRGS
jgi:tetratricopeptide (TPR) repeat protein